MFNGDMKEQGKKLIATLALAIKNLENPQTIIPALQQLAQKHLDYGVQKTHYALVGTALLQTLSQGLGDRFDNESKGAWSDMYDMVSEVMTEAAY